MSVAEKVCRHCGWHNEPGARMCGGCGRPLNAEVPSALRAPAEHAFEPLLPDDSPTVPDLPIVRPQPVRPGPYRQSSPPKPSPTLARAPRRTTPGRVFSVMFALLLVLFVCAFGTWALGVRPALHQQVDTAIRAQLDTVIVGFNAQIAPQLVQGGSFTLTSQQATDAVAPQVASSTPLRNVAIHISGGQVTIDYSAYGTDGRVSITLTVQDGRIVVSQTQVEGLVALVETGDELQATLNSELSKLRSDVKVTRIAPATNGMSISVQRSV